jgi:dihydropyrimidinase
VLVETCPQYLTLTKDVFDGKTGCLYATCPPVKLASDVKALWAGLNSGLINTIGTDHCAFSAADKMKCAGDFRKLRFGMPGVETSLSVVYSEGVAKRRITVQKLVEVMSENPAKIFGLFPRKGTIAQASDADITIFDPAKKWTVKSGECVTLAGWSPYEGMKLTGKTETTILRGKIIYDKGGFTSENGYGKFQKRKGGKFVC